jgi:GAF domain-containing protein
VDTRANLIQMGVAAPTRASRNGQRQSDLERLRMWGDTLSTISGILGFAPNLDAGLGDVARLLADATGCHACFIYLVEDDHLRLRVASPAYAHAVDQVELRLEEGLAGWVARHRSPAVIRENALADPRVKCVSELEDELFQSMVAVPLLARSGGSIGVVVLHTEAPRDFDDDVTRFISQTASLVAAAIDNERLQTAAASYADTIAALSGLSRRLAAATRRQEAYALATAGVRKLLGCDGCSLQLLGPAGALELVAADPPDRTNEVQNAVPAMPGGGREFAITAPVAAGGEPLGQLTAAGKRPFADGDDDLLRTVASQLALALRQAELIERLSDGDLVRDLFDALTDRRWAAAAASARAARCDLARPFLLLHVEPLAPSAEGVAWLERAERVERRVRQLAPTVFCDVGAEAARMLIGVGTSGASDDLDGHLAEIGADERVVIGRSRTRVGAEAGGEGLREAEDAARAARALLGGGGALPYERLGAYRYLVRLPLDDAPGDVHTEAVERLRAYDQRRGTQLLRTLEQYMHERRGIARTAKLLYIHPNTLRQRLDRVEELTGLDLASEDLLSLELAIKWVRLRAAAEVA